MTGGTGSTSESHGHLHRHVARQPAASAGHFIIFALCLFFLECTSCLQFRSGSTAGTGKAARASGAWIHVV